MLQPFGADVLINTARLAYLGTQIPIKKFCLITPKEIQLKSPASQLFGISVIRHPSLVGDLAFVAMYIDPRATHHCYPSTLVSE